MTKHFEAVRLYILRDIENRFEYFDPKLTSTVKKMDKKLYLMSAQYSHIDRECVKPYRA